MRRSRKAIRTPSPGTLKKTDKHYFIQNIHLCYKCPLYFILLLCNVFFLSYCAAHTFSPWHFPSSPSYPYIPNSSFHHLLHSFSHYHHCCIFLKKVTARKDNSHSSSRCISFVSFCFLFFFFRFTRVL